MRAKGERVQQSAVRPPTRKRWGRGSVTVVTHVTNIPSRVMPPRRCFPAHYYSRRARRLLSSRQPRSVPEPTAKTRPFIGSPAFSSFTTKWQPLETLCLPTGATWVSCSSHPLRCWRCTTGCFPLRPVPSWGRSGARRIQNSCRSGMEWALSPSASRGTEPSWMMEGFIPMGRRQCLPKLFRRSPASVLSPGLV